MVPLLKFWLHEEVRRAAVQTLPELIRSASMCLEKGTLQVHTCVTCAGICAA